MAQQEPNQILNRKHAQGDYVMRMLFRQPVEKPALDKLKERLETPMGEINLKQGEVGTTIFALKDQVDEAGSGEPAQLLLTDCEPVEKPLGDDSVRAQLMDSPQSLALMDECAYQVAACDRGAAWMHQQARGWILSDYFHILMSNYPDCVGAYFDASGILLTREELLDNPYPDAMGFVHFGIKPRLHENVEGGGMAVDTVGLHALGFPDVQLHFTGLDPQDVMHYALNIAIHQYVQLAPIDDGDTLQGLEEGSIWSCRYADAIMKPARVVLDIATGEYAAGERG